MGGVTARVVVAERAERAEGRTMCYCNSDDELILADLKRQGVPDEALLRDCCWRRISQVRGRTFSGSESTPSWDPDGEIWKELCRKRGYLHTRQNPRGF